jgi:hypothetical protein
LFLKINVPFVVYCDSLIVEVTPVGTVVTPVLMVKPVHSCLHPKGEPNEETNNNVFLTAGKTITQKDHSMC